jgi:hypothetical protein
MTEQIDTEEEGYSPEQYLAELIESGEINTIPKKQLDDLIESVEKIKFKRANQKHELICYLFTETSRMCDCNSC